MDLLLHFIVGAAIASFAGLPPEKAFAVAAVAAVGKEIYDNQHRDKHTPDWKDAAMTVAGGGVVYIIRKEF